MVRRAVAALATALLVAACGSSGDSTSTHAATSSTAAGSANAGSSTAPPPGSSTASSQNASGSTSTHANASSTTAAQTTPQGAARHTHTQPPESTPHFLVKLTIGSGGTVTPPGVAIGGHTVVELSVSNRSGSQAKLELAHGSAPVYIHMLAPGRTTTKLPALKNATYTLLIDGKPRGTLTIGAKAGP